MTLLQESETTLKKTPLYDRHVALNGKIVNFSGWALPVYYSGIIAEHRWTRESCSIFDVSHLGEIRVKGKGATRFLQHRLTNDMAKVSDGRMLYSLLCDERGFTMDDILIYREAEDDYYLIVNAANIQVDFEALKRYAPDSVELKNQSDEIACIAVQGPKAEAALARLFGWPVGDMAYYSFRAFDFGGRPVWVSRSGYTGEDGFEIFSANADSGPIWDRLIDAGKNEGILPAGLGARNTLRLEAGNALYGNDIDLTTTPLQAGLQWAVSFSKDGGFVGRDSLLKEKENGPARRLIAFEVLDKPVAREHYPLLKDGKKIGAVTSGSFGPTVGKNIGLGYVRRGFEAPDTTIDVEIYGRPVPARVVKRPFVPSKHKKG